MVTTPPATPARGFEILCHFLAAAEKKKRGAQAEAQRRIAAHIRAVTGKGTGLLAQYHNDPDISDDDKVALYKLCGSAIHFGNWSLLQGQVGSGDKRVDPMHTTPVTEQAVPDTTPEPPATPMQSTNTNRETSLAPATVDVNTSPEPQDELTRILLRRIEPYLPKGGAVDEDRVKAIIQENVPPPLGCAIAMRITPFSAMTASAIACTFSDGNSPLLRHFLTISLTGEVVQMGRQHYKFPLLIAALSQRLNVLLVGPAGSFKTTAAHTAAKALELSYEAMSVGPMTSKSDLFGFKDAGGTYHDTGLVRQFKNGGLFLADELDAGNAGVMTQINMGLANGHVSTPMGMIEKHKDFVFIGAANTFGMGANRIYVGRNQLDAATLDRFVMIDWDYDEGMEAMLVGVQKASPKLDIAAGGRMEPKEWLKHVHKLRAAIDKLAVRHVISPRATLHGAKLFDAGVGRTHVEEMVLWKGCEPATRDKIKSEAGCP